MKGPKLCPDWESIYNNGVPKPYYQLTPRDKERLNELYKEGMLRSERKIKIAWMEFTYGVGFGMLLGLIILINIGAVK